MTSQNHPVVLVVEDQPEIAALYETWLSSEYEVLVAHDLAKASTLLGDNIDVTVLDRRLSDGTGDEIARQVRIERLRCRVIIVSAYRPDFDVFEAGFDHYLRKPVRKTRLRWAVETVLRRNAYSELLDELFSLTTQLAAIESSVPKYVLETHPVYRDRSAQLKAVQSTVESIHNRMNDDDFRAAFHRLDHVALG